VSVRQTLLDIYPRPGHEYIGSAVLGLHVPVWSIIIAVMILGAYAVKLVFLDGGEELRDVHIDSYPLMSKTAKAACLFVILLGLINFGSVVLQCCVGECHAFSYQILNSLWCCRLRLRSRPSERRSVRGACRPRSCRRVRGPQA